MWTHAFLLVYVQPLPSLPTTLRHDFLLVGPPGKDTCQEAMSRMLTVCDQLGIPVASENTAASTTPGKARGADRANQVLAIQAQGHQEGAALTHRQALLCC